jgi:hypothetical protein
VVMNAWDVYFAREFREEDIRREIDHMERER